MEERSTVTGEHFDALVEQYGAMIYRIAWANVGIKADADDVLQEVLLLYFRKAPRFESEEHRRNWLINVTLKFCKKQHAVAFNRRRAALEDFPALETALNIEELELLWAVEALPAKYRSVIWLHYYEGFSVEEIGRMTGMKAATLRSRMNRARTMLKGALQ